MGGASGAVHKLRDSLQLNFAALLNSLLSATEGIMALTPVQQSSVPEHSTHI